MKLIYEGKFDGKAESLPQREHEPGAVKFKEVDDPKKLGLFANLAALFVFIGLTVLLVWRVGLGGSGSSFSIRMIIGVVIAQLLLFPHELLHAICFRGEVRLYTNFKNGLVFVAGTESMTKGRFVFMSALPNIVFGLIPFAAALLFPEWIGALTLGFAGAMALAMGCGDYYNIINALTQMPKGALTYLCGFNSWWYMPRH